MSGENDVNHNQSNSSSDHSSPKSQKPNWKKTFKSLFSSGKTSSGKDGTSRSLLTSADSHSSTNKQNLQNSNPPNFTTSHGNTYGRDDGSSFKLENADSGAKTHEWQLRNSNEPEDYRNRSRSTSIESNTKTHTYNLRNTSKPNSLSHASAFVLDGGSRSTVGSELTTYKQNLKKSNPFNLSSCQEDKSFFDSIGAKSGTRTHKEQSSRNSSEPAGVPQYGVTNTYGMEYRNRSRSTSVESASGPTKHNYYLRKTANLNTLSQMHVTGGDAHFKSTSTTAHYTKNYDQYLENPANALSGGETLSNIANGGVGKDMNVYSVIRSGADSADSASKGVQVKCLLVTNLLAALISVILSALIIYALPLITLAFSQNGIPNDVTTGLRNLYNTKLLPLETKYHFHDFHSPALSDADFDADPMVVVVGQPSVGKTTFIRNLLKKDYPGISIGSEHTDRFIVVTSDAEEGVVQGDTIVQNSSHQFGSLSKFGKVFLNNFQLSKVNSEYFRGISFVDTPGIPSGEKNQVDGGYVFSEVLQWFAKRADRIILLFDAQKLDISDGFVQMLDGLQEQEENIRIVLNKADLLDRHELMRVYGSLLWSLGKILQAPEIARVYIGSFWDQNTINYSHRNTQFEADEADLMQDLKSLLKNKSLRKLSDLTKRARLAKVHAYIISSVRKYMEKTNTAFPTEYSQANKYEAIANLGKIYEEIQNLGKISVGDFPDIKKMQVELGKHDFSSFDELNPKLVELVDEMLKEDLAKLLIQINLESANVQRTAYPAVDAVINKVLVAMLKDLEQILCNVYGYLTRTFDQMLQMCKPVIKAFHKIM